MSFLEFDKTQLINLECSLKKELIRSNGAGSFGSCTIINCNTRKYHGLLICPQEGLDGDNHVLLSSVDETIIQHNAEFHLGVRRYPGNVYEPKGHKYVREFVTNPTPKLTFRVGGVVLTRETLLLYNDERVLIRYTLEEAQSPTKLRLQPFLAFRNIHRLSKANNDVNRKFDTVPNGIRSKLYTGYPFLYMQLSRKNEFISVPDWYYNIEYIEEKDRGYECHEDLFVPGYFEFPIKKGESIIFSAGLREIVPAKLKQIYEKEVKSRVPRDSFYNCLVNAAQQFIVKRDGKTEITAGFPWFGRWGRDTFISLPGLTLAIGDVKTCKAVLDTMVADLHGPLFPNIGTGDNSALNSVDAPLWFFWAVQQYAIAINDPKKAWKEYGKKMQLILKGFRTGTEFNIKMQENGLINAGTPGLALTWMDAVVAGKPVTPRIGMPVEINALWYNAICFSLQAANASGDKKFAKEWSEWPSKIAAAFRENFWCEKRGFLADCINGEEKDFSIRPNQVIAVSLPFIMLNEDDCKSILDIVERELLTPRGLRTLSPEHPDYKGIYFGDQQTRDQAYHQGTVWPWLIGHFAEGYLKIHGKSGVAFIKRIVKNFEPVMFEHGIGTISEVYDGDPPHLPGGAISQAWSVGELLRIITMLEKYD